MFIRRGFYDLTTSDINNDIKVIDLMEIFDSFCSGEDQELMKFNNDFVIKCNICNFSFIKIQQFLLHNQSYDHAMKYRIWKY